MANKTKKYRRKRLKGGRTIKENIEKLASIGLQVGQNGIDYAVDNVAEMAGVDPNKSIGSVVGEIGQNMAIIKQALETPAGEQLLKNASAVINKTTEEVIAPAISELGKEVAEHSGKIVEEGTKALLNTAEEIPGPGTVIGLLRTGDNLINIAAEGTEMGEKLLSTTNDVSSKLEERKKEFNDLVGSFNNLINVPLEAGVNGLDKITNNMATNNMATNNMATNNMATNITNSINNSKNVMSNSINKSKNLMTNGINSINNSKNLMTNGINSINNSKNLMTNVPNMNNLNTVGNIVGGRLNNSLSEFMGSRIQHGGSITKKQHIFSRSMTRKHR
jgi:hypothetical protein